MHAYTGNVLHVDLTKQTTQVGHLEPEFLKKYLGGVGLATRLVYDNTPAGCDPLGPENVLVFACSAFAGTPIPVGTKHGVAAKSPLTGLIGDSLSGSHFSEMLRRAGWDALVLKGKAPRWTVLFIDDDRVTFLDASRYLGRGAVEVQSDIREQIGDENVRVSAIGPAGENLVRFASIDNDGRQVGRTGNGAVMGSKRLKAIAIRGTKPITVADPAGLMQEGLKLIKTSQGPGTLKYRSLGTPSNVLNMNAIGVLPTRNFSETTFEHADTISGEYLRDHFRVKAVACSGCSIACEQWGVVREGKYKGAKIGLDYEPLFAVGSNCGIGDLPAIIKLVQMADDLGMDGMSAGVVISWAMECYERGLLTKEDFDGLEPNFGNDDAAVALMEKIAHRDGIGDLLAEGTKRASEKLGKGSEHFAMHSKGLELPGYDPRSLKTTAAGYAVGTRGACHNRSLAYELDIKGVFDRFSAGPGRGPKMVQNENFACVLDCLVLCKFLRNCFDDFDTDVARIYTMTTGIDLTPEELAAVGERVCNLKKAFNIREGWTRADDTLPPRILEDPIPDGPSKGYFVSREELALLIDDYYQARGWTEEGLIPRDKLIELGLADIAEEIGVDAVPAAVIVKEG
ncbi:MAG: aldehyde ferredoxin oxidoreductase family protein [Anaerolineae bacterium]|jgi:aldehyde:ferredoxin oxidoreductase|nr:aldehyde ferredoxin oxidoreductase family protein [Chloroflexota bacterium]